MERLQSKMTENNIVLTTDKRNILPCAYTIFSLLKNTSQKIKINILAVDVNLDELQLLKSFQKAFIYCTISIRIVHPSKLAGAKQKIKHISNAAYLRLLIPNYFDERVVYLDTDLLIRHDISQLFDYDLGPNSIGAVANPVHVSMKYFIKSKTNNQKLRQQFIEDLYKMASYFGFHDPDRYLNSGVLVIDCMRLKEDSELFQNFIDIKSAGKFSGIMDNDWLIKITRGKLSFLPPIWNSLRGNTDVKHKSVPQHIQEYYKASMIDPAIVHFTGSNKPWDKEHTEDYLKNNPFLQEYLDVKAECDQFLQNATP